MHLSLSPVLKLAGRVRQRPLVHRIRRLVLRLPPFRPGLGLSGFAAIVLLGVVLMPLATRQRSVLAADPPAAPVPVAEAPPTEPQGEQPVIKLAADVSDRIASLKVAPGEVAGYVLDEQGRPVAGVSVDAWTWYPGNETVTDDKGFFNLKGFDKESPEVFFTKDGYSPEHVAQWPLGTGRGVILGQKTWFEGTVTDDEGKPVAAAVIRAFFGPIEGDGVMIGEVYSGTTTREDGTFRLYAAANQTYDLQVSAPGRGVARLSGLMLQLDESRTLPIALKPGVRFEAQVVDSIRGAPVQGFILWQWQGAKLMGTSDADGRIVIDNVIPGPAEFNCGGGEPRILDNGVRYYEHGQFGRWWSDGAIHPHQHRQIDKPDLSWQRNFDGFDFDLKVGMPPVKIVVEQGVTVSGHVIDPNGQPVEGATVAPALTGTGNSLTGDTRYSVKTDKYGEYHVVLPASNDATYNLVVHDGDYSEWRNWANGVAPAMKTVPGQVIEEYDLQLTEPATVRGRVTVAGKPAANRDVRTHALDKLENRYYDPTTRTQADGTFELKFVRPGEHFLQVEPFWLAAEDANQGSLRIEVKAGETLEGVELQAAAFEDGAGIAVPAIEELKVEEPEK